MSARVVRQTFNVYMDGLDHHNGQYILNIFTELAPPGMPPIPHPPGVTPHPYSFHVATTKNIAVLCKENKSNPTVIADDDCPVVSRGHALRALHIPPGGNVLIPVTNIFSTSTFKLGVGSVVATKGPLASTAKWIFGFNVNCGDPCSSPLLNLTLAASTVHLAPTSQDWDVAKGEFMVTALVEAGVSIGLTYLAGPLFQKTVAPLVAPLAGRVFLRVSFDNIGRDAAKKLASDAAREGTEKILTKEGSSVVADQLGRHASAEAKKAAEEAFQKSVKESGERAAQAAAKTIEQGGRSSSLAATEEAAKDAARDATFDWFVKQGARLGQQAKQGAHKGSAVDGEAADAASEAAKRLVSGTQLASAPGLNAEAAGGDYAKGKTADAVADWANVPERTP